MKYKIKKSFLFLLCIGLFFVTPVNAQEEQQDIVTIDLDTAIYMALNNNPKTYIAEGGLKNAMGLKKQTIGSFGIKINASHTSSRMHNFKQQTGNDSVIDNFKNVASVSYPVYTGGKRKGSIRAARRSEEIAELEIGRTDQEVKLDATSSYFTVLQTRNIVKLSRESVVRLEEHLKNVQAQYDVGVVAKVDLLRSEVELADAQQELIKAENNFDIAVADLNNVIGLPVETNTVVSDDLTYNEYNATLAYCADFAKTYRPEILQAEKAIDAAKGNIMSARSGYLPSIDVTASYAWDKDDFPGDQKNNWQAAAILNFNVFDSNTTRGAVDAAQGTLLQREAEYKQIQDNVSLEVRSNYLSLREAEKRIYTASVTVEKAQEDYKIAQVRYQAGVGTNTDVLDAHVALTNAETNYVQALYDYNTSWAKLEKSMGIPVIPEGYVQKDLEEISVVTEDNSEQTSE